MRSDLAISHARLRLLSCLLLFHVNEFQGETEIGQARERKKYSGGDKNRIVLHDAALQDSQCYTLHRNK